MRASAFIIACVAFVLPVTAQQISDMYTTSTDKSKLFAYSNNGPKFGTAGSKGSADIVVNDGQVYQTIVGHGAALTDSSAKLLNDLKTAKAESYNSLLQTLFDPTDGKHNAGLSYLRVPLGASDFSASTYSYDDVKGDTSLQHFDINKAPAYLFSVIKDIMAVNPYLKVHILPWSPPGWMKDSGTMNGGNFLDKYSDTYANYLLKCLEGFKSHGITAYAIGIQNEPENSNPSYPTAKISAAQGAKIATTLRGLMDKNGFQGTKLVGYEHNWKDAAGYPVQTVKAAPSAYAGVAFHCYSGSADQQDAFHTADPSKEIYMTECTGTFGSDFGSDLQWYMDNLYLGAVEHNAMSVLMWNIALDPKGNPKTPGTTSCGGAHPCRAVVTIDGTSYTMNQEFYAMAQANKAIVPKDKNGPFGQRIGVSASDKNMHVGAYRTPRANPSDQPRYNLVVSNKNSKPTEATIEFRGAQAKYTFPVGVTTLSWYATADGKAAPASAPSSTASSAASHPSASAVAGHQRRMRRVRRQWQE